MNVKLRRLLLILLLVSGTAMVSLAHQQIATSDPLGNTDKQTSLTSANDGLDSPVSVPDGLHILLLLASGYGVFKYFQGRKRVKLG